jgi:hypothetical protein
MSIPGYIDGELMACLAVLWGDVQRRSEAGEEMYGLSSSMKPLCGGMKLRRTRIDNGPPPPLL